MAKRISDSDVKREQARSVGGAKRRWADKEVFTVGQVAEICSVAQRTAAKWCDAGLLPSYRLPATGPNPGSRRILRLDLVKFMHARGMRVFPLELFCEEAPVVDQVEASLGSGI